ncbi:hypothetical protein F9278_00050 (plasmid) [Streptomyces phaeolivaceus]|uniref:Uncharacterized protein n=1 Tax=Streptomyces phaeolivaceus TaxID=2653200 RepID=A0A5P8JVW4_9ACTN|nr:hypothetical protein [Streptomyces phaeolivaceus]QFQ94850.1 hypothetical protein F9278_00050 [Streptomyces phaeolivaceus]
MTTPSTRPWHDTVPPYPDALLFRPIAAAHPAGPGGQLARRPDGSWWYRELAVVAGTEETLPELLRADLAHALRRGDELMAAADGAAGDGDFAEADRLAELSGMLGTQEVIDLSRALQEAGALWRDRRSTRTVESLAEWIEAPDALARIAESLRTGEA